MQNVLYSLIQNFLIGGSIIASISYEFIRLTGKYQMKVLFRALSIPNLMLQSLTTKQPDDSQIEVAVAAMQATIEADQNSK